MIYKINNCVKSKMPKTLRNRGLGKKSKTGFHNIQERFVHLYEDKIGDG